MRGSNGLDFKVLKYALEVGGDHGRSATWAELRRGIIEETGDCRDDELREAFIQLHSHAFITLEKWDDARKHLRDYGDYRSRYEFFMRGPFRVCATSLGCVYWETLLRGDAVPDATAALGEAVQ